jgi:hypothetical protein
MALPIKPRKFPNIEKLADYSSTPNEKFWDNFPTRDLPTSARAFFVCSVRGFPVLERDTGRILIC